MELSANLNPTLVIQVVKWAARHNLAVEAVIGQALTEWMMDVDSGLLVAPRPALRSLLGRRRKGQ